MEGIRPPLLSDPGLRTVWEKVEARVRLGREDGMAVLATQDLAGAGQMADRANRARNGDAAMFVVNRQINPTNVCVLDCRFCAFSAKRGEPEAYELTVEECVAALDSGPFREVHVVGGLHPDWPWEYYTGLMRAIKERHPGTAIKAWSAVEIDYFAKKFRKADRDVLAELRASGLDLLPGGGAEVFSERVRAELFPAKIGAGRWREIHVLAHSMGIRTNATMLYGHIETAEERVDHVLSIRDIQDETGGFLSFIPLAFQPGKTGVKPLVSSAVDDLKTVAMSRLLLDNVGHIKAYWVMLGEETASVALSFGASDLDGTVGDEKVAHAAGAESPVAMTRERMVRLIRDAGRTPVERDAFYRPVGDHP